MGVEGAMPTGAFRMLRRSDRRSFDTSTYEEWRSYLHGDESPGMDDVRTRWISLVVAVVASVAVFSGGVAQASGTHRPASRGCHFRGAIWGLVQQTAIDAHYFSYYDTDSVENEKAGLDEQMSRAEWKYRFPHGWWSLETAWNHVWSHLWDVGFWNGRASSGDGSSLMDDWDQANAAGHAAQGSMPALWHAAHNVC